MQDELDTLMTRIRTLSRQKRQELAAHARERRMRLGINIATMAEHSQCTLSRAQYLNLVIPRAITRQELQGWTGALGISPSQLLDPQTIPQVRRSGPLPECATVSEEIRKVGAWLVRDKLLRRTFDIEAMHAHERRLADMFSMRYGVLGEDMSTLQAIGDVFGVTRERVRQVVDKMLFRIGDLHVDTHVLAQLRGDVKSRVPMRMEELDQELRPQLGEQLSVVGADRFSRDVFGLPVTDVFAGIGARAKTLPPVAVAPNEFDAQLTRAIRDAALKVIRSVGAAQIHLVTGMAGEELARGLSVQVVRKAIQIQAGFEWLNEKDGWFWLGPEHENRVLLAVRKMLSVADRKLDVEVIQGGLTRARLERYREDKARPVRIDLPQPLLVDMLRRVPWLERIQHNDFRLREPVTPASALSEVELAIYQALKIHGSIASRYSLMKTLADAGSVKPNSANMIMDGTPIVQRITDGVYALRGVPFSPAAYEQALQTVGGPMNRLQAEKNIAITEDGRVIFEFTLTDGRVGNGLVDLPRPVFSAGGAVDYHLNGSGKSIPVKGTKGSAGRVTRLARHLAAAGVETGQRIRLEFTPATRALSYALISQPVDGGDGAPQ